MSSSLFVASEPKATAELLGTSFELIRNALPDAYRTFLSRMDAFRVRITVGPEVFEVWAEGGTIQVASETSRAVDAAIAANPQTILDVLAADQTLHGALLNGELRVVATLERLMALHEALLAYTHAAVRCAGFSELLGRFRALHRPGEASR